MRMVRFIDQLPASSFLGDDQYIPIHVEIVEEDRTIEERYTSWASFEKDMHHHFMYSVRDPKWRIRFFIKDSWLNADKGSKWLRDLYSFSSRRSLDFVFFRRAAVLFAKDTTDYMRQAAEGWNG